MEEPAQVPSFRNRNNIVVARINNGVASTIVQVTGATINRQTPPVATGYTLKLTGPTEAKVGDKVKLTITIEPAPIEDITVALTTTSGGLGLQTPMIVAKGTTVVSFDFHAKFTLRDLLILQQVTIRYAI